MMGFSLYMWQIIMLVAIIILACTCIIIVYKLFQENVLIKYVRSLSISRGKVDNNWVKHKARPDFGFSSPEMRDLFEKAGWKRAQTGSIYLKYLLLTALASGIIAFFTYDFLPVPSMFQLHIYKLAFSLMCAALIILSFKPYLILIGKKRSQEMEPFFLDVMDLMIITLRSGMSLERSLAEINASVDIPNKQLKKELLRLEVELEFIGAEIALKKFRKRFDAPLVREFVTISIQSRKQGSPIAENLKVVIDEWQKNYIVALEERAQRIPLKITFITAFFFLPTLFIFILAPLFLQL